MKNLILKKGGMTLAEVIVAIAIFSMIMTVVIAFEVNIFSYNSSISASYTTTQDAQTILKIMISELRRVAPGANGAYPLTSVGTSSLVFFSDSDSNGVQDQITYVLVGTDLYKREIAPTGNPPVYNVANQTSKVIIRNIRNGITDPIFEYFDASYNGTSTPLTQPVTATQVRLIKVNIKMDVDPRRSPLPVTYTSQASLRNLKTNL